MATLYSCLDKLFHRHHYFASSTEQKEAVEPEFEVRTEALEVFVSISESGCFIGKPGNLLFWTQASLSAFDRHDYVLYSLCSPAKQRS